MNYPKDFTLPQMRVRWRDEPSGFVLECEHRGETVQAVFDCGPRALAEADLPELIWYPAMNCIAQVLRREEAAAAVERLTEGAS